MKLAEIFHFLAEIKVQTYKSMGNRLVVTNIVINNVLINVLIKTFGGQSSPSVFLTRESEKDHPIGGACQPRSHVRHM